MTPADALWARSRTLLGSDERIEEILLARRGTRTALGGLFPLLRRWYAIVVTDRSIAVLACGRMHRARPERVIRRIGLDHDRPPGGPGDQLQLRDGGWTGRFELARRFTPADLTSAPAR